MRRLLGGREARAVNGLIDELAGGDLYDMQERYVLLVRPHTDAVAASLRARPRRKPRPRPGHGRPDDNVRGTRGLKIDARELPDFLPLFLEFLSTLPLERRKEMFCASRSTSSPHSANG